MSVSERKGEGYVCVCIIFQSTIKQAKKKQKLNRKEGKAIL